MEEEANSDTEVAVKRRPRRSTVRYVDLRYHEGRNVSTLNSSCPNNFTITSLSEDSETEESSTDDEDEEVEEEEMIEYVAARSPEDTEGEAQWREERQKTRDHLVKMCQQKRDHLYLNRELETEIYFDAPLRPTFRKVKTKPTKTLTSGKTGAERGSKPRKGNRTGTSANDKLPVKPESNFSVSKEIQKLDLDTIVLSENMSGRISEENLERRFEEIQRDFSEWMFLMKEGFSIMLHGYGAKGQVFEDFKSFLDEKYLVIYINGLFPRKLKARRFLVDFCQAIHCKTKIAGSNVQQIAEEVQKEMESLRHPRVFFLVQNCEMLAVKNLPVFQVVCALAQVKFINLIASCDHVNSFVGIDQASIIALNFWWFLCPTFAPYERELENLPGVFGQDQDKVNTKNSLQHIFKSLTANAKKAFTVLATLQLNSLASEAQTKQEKSKGSKRKAGQGHGFEGIQFRELARRCAQGFIAHSDQTLRTLLIEFLDHKLITYSGKMSSMDSLMINLDAVVLEDFLKSNKVSL